MVKAKLNYTMKDAIIFVQRAKYKHWFQLGHHKPTDSAFHEALLNNDVMWIVPKTTLL